MRVAIKKAGLRWMRGSGLFTLAANSKARRERLLILCYHGISLRDEHRWRDLLYISPEQFRQRLAILKSIQASVLTLGDAMDRLRRRSLPPRSVVITFDDGFYDFYRHAAPALAAFGYPSTLYLTTHYCTRRAPIFHLMLSYLLWKCGRESIELEPYGLNGPLPTRTFDERHAIVDALVAWADARDLTTLERDDIARSVAERVGIDYDELLKSRMLQLMTPAEVEQISKDGVDIELHTHRHRTPMDRGLFLREITDNRALIREFTGRETKHFCYPSGVYASEFLPWLTEAGVESATTCEVALAKPDSEPLLLPRFLDDSRVDALDFESWVCGFLH